MRFVTAQTTKELFGSKLILAGSLNKVKVTIFSQYAA